MQFIIALLVLGGVVVSAYLLNQTEDIHVPLSNECSQNSDCVPAS